MTIINDKRYQISSYKIHLSKLNNIKKKTKIDTYIAHIYFPLDLSTIHTSRTFFNDSFYEIATSIDRNIHLSFSLYRSFLERPRHRDSP